MRERVLVCAISCRGDFTACLRATRIRRDLAAVAEAMYRVRRAERLSARATSRS